MWTLRAALCPHALVRKAIAKGIFSTTVLYRCLHQMVIEFVTATTQPLCPPGRLPEAIVLV